MDLQEKKRIVEKRIVRELALYLEQHKSGIRIQILSAKYATACQDLGGFPEIIEELRRAGRIVVDYAKNGARTVTLGNGTPLAHINTDTSWF